MRTLPEVDLPAGSLVIADLHLDVGNGPSLEPFLRWLSGLEGVPRLVILGDLFEYWIGPAQARLPGAQTFAACMGEVVRAGTQVDIVPGNRDFLLDPTFERLTGCHVHHDALLGITETGERVLFLHGDELCTEDRGHQRLRRVLRAPLTRWIAFHLPMPIATAVAKRLRRASRDNVGRKDNATVKMMPDACRGYAAQHTATVLACGHAHRHRDEDLPNGPRWLVVDDFGGVLDAIGVQPDHRLELCASGVERAAGAASVDSESEPDGSAG